MAASARAYQGTTEMPPCHPRWQPPCPATWWPPAVLAPRPDRASSWRHTHQALAKSSR
jgi:hypothetical protein